MGCWDGTCGITQLPINRDEKVRLIMIARDMKPIMHPDTGYSYSYGLYYPITVAIPGTYDEVGGALFDDTDPVVKTCLDAIHNFVLPDDDEHLVSILRREGDEAPYVKDLMTNEKVTPGVFLIREGVYQALIDGFYSDDLPWDLHYPKPDYRAEACKLARQIVGWAREAAQATEKFSDAYMRLFSVLRPFRGEEDGLNKLAQAWSFLPALTRHGMGALETSLSAIATKDGVTEEDLLPILLAVADFVALRHMMSTLRRGFVPQAGAGSDSEDLVMHRYLAKTTLNEIEALERHCDDDDD